MVAAVPFVGRAFAAGERVAVSWDAADIWPVALGDQQEGDQMKRRTFVGAAAASLPGLQHPVGGGARAQSKEIRMIESGGASGELIEKGYIEPLFKKTGIKVVRESPSSLGKLRALVESGQTTTTLFELGSGVVLQAKKLGLIEKVDWAAVDPAAMFPEAKAEYGFGYQYFSTIMAWRAGAKEPKNFTEFFDSKAFPGKRCLPDFPHYCLPFALQATGVPIDKLFPLDVDTRLQEAERGQEGRRGVVEGGRPAAAAHEGQRGAVLDLLVRAASSAIRRSASTSPAARPIFPSSPSSRAPSPRTRRRPTSCSTRCRCRRTRPRPPR